MTDHSVLVNVSKGSRWYPEEDKPPLLVWPNRGWREDDILALRALYPRYGMKFTAAALRRTENQITSKASHLGIIGRRNGKRGKPTADTRGGVA